MDYPNKHALYSRNVSYDDHETLIRIDEQLKTFIRLYSDHEMRIRRLEWWGALAIGALAIIQTLLGFYFK